MINKNLLYKTGVYKLKIGTHIYIGSSVNLYKRLGVHFRTLKKGSHENPYLQRCVNKYGIENLSYEIVEIYENISVEELLKHEAYYIKFFSADLNLKLDPTTQRNCITTSKKVFQFSLYGDLIKSWVSISEAARALKINASNITTSILKRNRQRIAGGYLWDYTPKYTGDIKILYVFDLSGMYLNRFLTTVEIYEKYFPEMCKKSAITSIKTHIDSNTPYKNIYISTNKFFKIPENYVPRYKDDKLEGIFKTNPVIYQYSFNGELIKSQRLNEWKNPSYIKQKIRSQNSKYSLGAPNKKLNWNSLKIKVTNIVTLEIKYFDSLKLAATELLPSVANNMKNAWKHLKRHTPYKGFLFEEVL